MPQTGTATATAKNNSNGSSIKSKDKIEAKKGNIQKIMPRTCIAATDCCCNKSTACCIHCGTERVATLTCRIPWHAKHFITVSFCRAIIAQDWIEVILQHLDFTATTASQRNGRQQQRQQQWQQNKSKTAYKHKLAI